MFVPALLAFVSLVEGETCPAPLDVEARVRAILHLSPDQELSEGFAVERHEAGLYVALHGADSSLIGERTLPTAGSCDELAQAAAVVLAAWLSDVHPDFAGALPPPELPPAPPAPEPEPAKPPPPPEPSPPPLPRPVAPEHHLHLALGVGGDVSNGLLSPALLLGVSYGAEQTGFALTARGLLTMSRDQPLGPGKVSWRRWPVGVGPTLRLATQHVDFAFSAGPALAWLRVGGDSFDRVATQSGFVGGGFGELLASGRARPLTVFGALNVQFYPATTTARVSGLDLQWDLPALSSTLVVGARFSP